MRETDLHQARNSITWGSRLSRVTTQSAQDLTQPALQGQVSDPSSCTDSGIVDALSDHQGQQQVNISSDLLQLISTAAAGLQYPDAARSAQQSRQAAPAALTQQHTAATTAAARDSRAVSAATTGKGSVQQHSDVVVKLGQVLLNLRRRCQQDKPGSSGAWDKRDGPQLSRRLPAAAAAAVVGGSKRPLQQSSLDIQPAKVAKAGQLSGPGHATAGTSVGQVPTTATTAPTAGLCVAAMKLGHDTSSVPAAVVQGLHPGSGQAPGAFSSSFHNSILMKAARAVTAGAAQHTAPQLPVLQLPLAMRVSYLRAAGFLPPDASKSKRKADKRPDDGSTKPAVPRKRGRRKFSGDEPVVGWDERTYTHGSDRQRVWEEHKMVLRMMQVVLAAEPAIAARVKQASVEYNARSCVSCWRARPVSGSWFCSRPICWDKHKQEYEGEAATAAAVTAADEAHWNEVKRVVQPVLKQRQQQKGLQREGSSTTAAAEAGEGATLAAPAGGDAAAAAEDAKAPAGSGCIAAAAADASAAALKTITSGSSSGDADAVAGQLDNTANSQAAAAPMQAQAATPAQTVPVAAVDSSAVASGSGTVSCAAEPEQAEVQQGSKQNPFLVLHKARQLIDKLEAEKCKHVTQADVETLQNMKDQIKLEVSSYNAHMMRLTHFIRKVRRNFQRSSDIRAQPTSEHAHGVQGADEIAVTNDRPLQQHAAATTDNSSSKEQPAMLPGSAAAGDAAKQDSNSPELAAADASAKAIVAVSEALPSQVPAMVDAVPAIAVSQSAEPAITQQHTNTAKVAEALAAATAADATDAGDKAAAVDAHGPAQALAVFTLPTREYKYPDLKRLWEEHQLNLRVLLIEVKDKPTALARVQDVIKKVFYRPCLRCMSHGGHKCGNGCWFCSNCQRMWGKANLITEQQAWTAITTGVGVDPKFIARRRSVGLVPLADGTPPVELGNSNQSAEAMVSVSAPAAAVAAGPQQ